MRGLARREPTFALHVHVGVPDAQRAIRLVNRLRAHLPLLLALSASSPFSAAADRPGLEPHDPVPGLSRGPGSRGASRATRDWVVTVDLLVRSGAIPEPTFLWWDVRPQPRLGTVEVRIMDAQPPTGRHRRADRARPVARAPRARAGLRPRAQLVDARRCWPRTASSPRATPPPAELIDPVQGPRPGGATARRRARLPPARTPRRSTRSRSSRTCGCSCWPPSRERQERLMASARLAACWSPTWPRVRRLRPGPRSRIGAATPQALGAGSSCWATACCSLSIEHLAGGSGTAIVEVTPQSLVHVDQLAGLEQPPQRVGVHRLGGDHGRGQDRQLPGEHARDARRAARVEAIGSVRPPGPPSAAIERSRTHSSFVSG